MTFEVLAIDHVVLRARDAEAMIAFYGDVLGCEVERSLPGIGLYQLRAGASLIDIIDTASELASELGGGAANGEARNMDHFCLRIAPFDEAGLRDHLGRHGISVGDVVTRYGAEGDGPSLYIQDPEGNTVELKGPAIGNGI